MLYLIARVTPLSSFQFQQFIRMLCSGMATFIEAVETSDLARRQELVDKMILQYNREGSRSNVSSIQVAASEEATACSTEVYRVVNAKEETEPDAPDRCDSDDPFHTSQNPSPLSIMVNISAYLTRRDNNGYSEHSGRTQRGTPPHRKCNQRTRGASFGTRTSWPST